MTGINNITPTIGDLLDRQAQRFSSHEALVHVDWGIRYSYAQFQAECERMACGLMAIGINKGDHVGIWATNYPEWVVAQFATAKIGAVLVTVNPAYRTHELEYLLHHSDVAALILIGRFRTSDYVSMVNQVVPELSSSVPEELLSRTFPHLRNVIFIPPHTRCKRGVKIRYPRLRQVCGSGRRCWPKPMKYPWMPLLAARKTLTPMML